jgi:hypothetical protein
MHYMEYGPYNLWFYNFKLIQYAWHFQHHDSRKQKQENLRERYHVEVCAQVRKWATKHSNEW